MPFKKGQSGNPGGRRKEKLFADAMRMEIKEAGDDNYKLRQIARKLLDMAEKGDMAAIKEVADRIDGKVPQAVGTPQDEDGIGPLVVEIVRFGDDPAAE